MKNSQDIISNLWTELEETLRCDGLVHVDLGDSDQQTWQVQNPYGRSSNIQFIVYVEDTEDTLFRVVIDENGIEKPVTKTNDPKMVIQAAKAFKSEYL